MMDSTIRKVNQQKIDYITNLDESGLKNYINILVRKYYIAYLQDDEQKCANYWKQIHETTQIFENEFDNLDRYINQCMVTTANHTIERLLARESKLHPPYMDDDLTNPKGLSNLTKAFQNGRKKFHKDNENKKHIASLHDMMVVGATIDENMVELVDNIYNSFYQQDDDVGGAT